MSLLRSSLASRVTDLCYLDIKYIYRSDFGIPSSGPITPTQAVYRINYSLACRICVLFKAGLAQTEFTSHNTKQIVTNRIKIKCI